VGGVAQRGRGLISRLRRAGSGAPLRRAGSGTQPSSSRALTVVLAFLKEDGLADVPYWTVPSAAADTKSTESVPTVGV
jgi:hypothetical protein